MLEKSSAGSAGEPPRSTCTRSRCATTWWSPEPVLRGLIGRIAKDEERHEEFFANLGAHCLGYTHAAIARVAAELAKPLLGIVEVDLNVKHRPVEVSSSRPAGFAHHPEHEVVLCQDFGDEVV
jgi:hypothetical protein